MDYQQLLRQSLLPDDPSAPDSWRTRTALATSLRACLTACALLSAASTGCSTSIGVAARSPWTSQANSHSRFASLARFSAC